MSTLDASLGSKGARIRRNPSKSTPRKNLCALISSAPPRPRRFSVLQTRLGKQLALCADILLYRFIPSNQIFSFRAQLNIFWEVKGLAPVNNLAVRIMSIFSTERWPSNLAFEHDRTQAPPIAILTIAMAAEDFWSNIIRSTNG